MVENFSQDSGWEYNNKSFVVTNKEKPTLRELSKIFEEVSGAKLSINWGGMEYRDREVMKPYCLGSCVPNWRQKFTLREAIEKVIFK